MPPKFGPGKGTHCRAPVPTLSPTPRANPLIYLALLRIVYPQAGRGRPMADRAVRDCIGPLAARAVRE